MSDLPAFDWSKLLITRADKLAWLLAIEDAKHAIYQGKDWQQVLKMTLPAECYKILSLDKRVSQLDDSALAGMVHQWLDNIHQQMEQIDEIKITISFLPTYEDLASLQKKFKTVWQTEVVLDWNYDPLIMAGMRIYFQGKLWDLSLDQIIKQRISLSG